MKTNEHTCIRSALLWRPVNPCVQFAAVKTFEHIRKAVLLPWKSVNTWIRSAVCLFSTFEHIVMCTTSCCRKACCCCCCWQPHDHAAGRISTRAYGPLLWRVMNPCVRLTAAKELLNPCMWCVAVRTREITLHRYVRGQDWLIIITIRHS